MTSTRYILLGLALASGLTACDDTPPPVPPPPAKAQPAQKAVDLLNAEQAAAEASADANEASAYAYSPIGKRDPFRSLIDEIDDDADQPELQELQRFELDQLKLVAIVTRTAAPYAMVEDPIMKGHTLTRGTLIGKNWGRIAAITEECIVIKEEYRDYTGRKVTNKTSKCLPKPDDIKLD